MNILKKLFSYLFRRGKKEREKPRAKSVEKREEYNSSALVKEEKSYSYKKLEEEEERKLEEERGFIRRKLWDLEERINKECLPNDNLLEKMVIKALWNIKNKESKVLWNIYPRSKNGALGQVDVIYITAYKIYVIECKDYKTCIDMKGEEEGKIAEFRYKSGKVYKGCNPIFQNKGHIWLLKSYLNIPEKFFESIVVIVASDEIKGVIESDKVIYLKNSRRNEIKTRLEEKVKESGKDLTDKNILDIGEKLLKIMNPSKDVVNEHIEYIKSKKRDISLQI